MVGIFVFVADDAGARAAHALISGGLALSSPAVACLVSHLVTTKAKLQASTAFASYIQQSAFSIAFLHAQGREQTMQAVSRPEDI